MADLWAVFENNLMITGSPIGDYDTALEYHLIAEGEGGGYRPGDTEVKAVCEIHQSHPEGLCEAHFNGTLDQAGDLLITDTDAGLLGRVVEGLRRMED